MAYFRGYFFFVAYTTCTISLTRAEFPQCIGTCYSGLLSPKKENVYQGKFIKGFSYKNFTVSDFKRCYSSCKQDCRCKACQVKGQRCELLEGDTKFCKLDLHDDAGYVHYDLEQTKFQGKSHMVPHVDCYNGCCKSQPCQNGGTCTETCQDPKQKFTCSCKGIYSGNLCERKVSSCEEIAKNGGALSHGQRTIYRIDTGAALTVYCDFTTPNQAWTLIESFNLENNGNYKNKPFYVDFPRNVQYPVNFADFRLPLDTIKYLISRSTQFRATCAFPHRIANGKSLKRDSLIGSLKEYDFFSRGHFHDCVTYPYINIRGIEYFNQPADTYHKSTQHLHIDNGCGFNVPDIITGEEFFGFYNPPNPAFICTNNLHSKTSWWLGGEIQKCLKGKG